MAFHDLVNSPDCHATYTVSVGLQASHSIKYSNLYKAFVYVLYCTYSFLKIGGMTKIYFKTFKRSITHFKEAPIVIPRS